MKIVEPSFEIQDQLDRGPIARRIEACGRLCYKSEEKMTEDSAIPFIKKIALHGHNSVLEMAVVTFTVQCHPEKIFDFFACQPRFLIVDRTETGLLLTGSIRAFRELYKTSKESGIVNNIMILLCERYPYLFEDLFSDGEELRIADPAIAVTKMELDEVEQLPPELLLRHRMVGVKLIVNRAVTHELVRHRPCSFLQESQRYCRYSRDTFGNEVSFVRPLFFAEDSPEFAAWKEAMEEAEKKYFTLLETATAQAARTVLPNSCKTEIIVYCNLEEWRHIFALRTSSGADPSMREIMIPLQVEMKKRFSGIDW